MTDTMYAYTEVVTQYGKEWEVCLYLSDDFSEVWVDYLDLTNNILHEDLVYYPLGWFEDFHQVVEAFMEEYI